MINQLPFLINYVPITFEFVCLLLNVWASVWFIWVGGLGLLPQGPGRVSSEMQFTKFKGVIGELDLGNNIDNIMGCF